MMQVLDVLPRGLWTRFRPNLAGMFSRGVQLTEITWLVVLNS